MWRSLHRTRLEARHGEVLEHDRAVLEALSCDADTGEHLHQHDLGVTCIRRPYRAGAAVRAAKVATPGCAWHSDRGASDAVRSTEP